MAFITKSPSRSVTHFGCHRHCGNGDIMTLLCHVILQDHTIRGSCDFMGSSSLC